MKRLPVPDPGAADQRSAWRYLLWLARTQAGTVIGGVLLGIGWMAAPALAPAVVGRAIYALGNADQAALLPWSGAVLALGLTQLVLGIMRHRFAVTNWLAAAYRTVQLITRQAARLGGALPRRVATGEVVSVGTSDVAHIGHALDVTARGAGSVVALVVVAAILLRASVPLGLVVVIGVPTLMALVALLLRPLHRRQSAYREATGALAGRAGDIVAGLRILRGVGGEAAFAGRYRQQSQQLRTAGVRVVRVLSYLEAAQVLLPGLFVAVAITTTGSRRWSTAGSPNSAPTAS